MWIALLFITLSAGLPTTTLARADASSAYAFVQKWVKTYGVDHRRAATMMTKHYRGGRSEAEWASLYGAYLDAVQYKHLGGELISMQEDDHKAQVILKSTVDSIRGPTIQHEIYNLVKVDGRWLIDFINIQDENFGTGIEAKTTQDDSHTSESPPRYTPSQ